VIRAWRKSTDRRAKKCGQSSAQNERMNYKG
jgi:hypothetical protein